MQRDSLLASPNCLVQASANRKSGAPYGAPRRLLPLEAGFGAAVPAAGSAGAFCAAGAPFAAGAAPPPSAGDSAFAAAFGFLITPPNGTLTRIAGREAKYDQGRNAATYSSIHKDRTLSGTPSSGARSPRPTVALDKVPTHVIHRLRWVPRLQRFDARLGREGSPAGAYPSVHWGLMHELMFEAPPVLCPPVSPGEILSKSGQIQRLVQPCPRVIVKTVGSLASMTQLEGQRVEQLRVREPRPCALDARACAFDRTYGHNRTRNGCLRVLPFPGGEGGSPGGAKSPGGARRRGCRAESRIPSQEAAGRAIGSATLSVGVGFGPNNLDWLAKSPVALNLHVGAFARAPGSLWGWVARYAAPAHGVYAAAVAGAAVLQGE
eukprot:gene15568-biopygen676